MHPVDFLQQRIEEGIRHIAFNDTPAELYEPVHYTLRPGGKRMRPLLALLACDACEGDIGQALPPALGLELFHNFTLLHDDIMDRAPLRRGQPTVHAKWDTSTAILAGDVLFVKSYQLAARCPDAVVRPVTDLFSRTAIEVCEGQQLDLNFERRETVSMADYLHMITLKTSVLPAAALMTGALVAGAAEKDAALLYEAGKNTGIAFQVMDDVLDVYGDEHKFGKQKGGDILANKKTCLPLKTLELCGDADREKLLALYRDPSRSQTKVAAVTALFDKAGVKTHLDALMQEHYDRALAALDRTSLKEDNKKVLKGFFEGLMRRER